MGQAPNARRGTRSSGIFGSGMATSYSPAALLAAPERASLLALLVADRLACALERPELASRAAALRGSVALRGGPMAVTLTFDGASIRIADGVESGARAVIRGDLGALLAVAATGQPLRLLLTGRLAVRGSLPLAARLLSLLTAT